MINTIELLKSQSWALGDHLALHEGCRLKHGHCLHAIGVIHAHRDWHSLSHAIQASSAEAAGLILETEVRTQAARLDNFISIRFGRSLKDPVGAIAATRLDGISEMLKDLGADASGAGAWAEHGHPELGGKSVHELVRTDDGYEQVERLLQQTLAVAP